MMPTGGDGGRYEEVKEQQIEEGPNGEWFHLVVPAGGYLDVTPIMEPKYGSWTHWSIQIDCRYTTTGEGGGFALIGVDDEYPLPAYIRHFDGRGSDKPPSAQADSLAEPDDVKAINKEAQGEEGKALTKEQTQKIAELMDVEKQKHLKEAAYRSAQWHRLVITEDWNKDQIKLFIDGKEVSQAINSYQRIDHRFQLFPSTNAACRLQHDLLVRMIVFTGGRDESFTWTNERILRDFQMVNDDLPLEVMRNVMRTRELREGLYLPTTLIDRHELKRVRSLLLKPEPPVLWSHPLVNALLSQDLGYGGWVTVNELASDWRRFAEDMMKTDLLKPHGLNDEGSLAILRSMREALRQIVEKHKLVSDLKVEDDDGKKDDREKKTQTSDWEAEQKKAKSHLEVVKSLAEHDPTSVHIVPLHNAPGLIFLVITTESSAEMARMTRNERLLIKDLLAELWTKDAYVVSGAGFTPANGIYSREGEYGGTARYVHEKGQIWMIRYTLPSGSQYWYLADKDNLDRDIGDYYRIKCAEGRPPLGEWEKAESGVLPCPTIAGLIDHSHETRAPGTSQGEDRPLEEVLAAIHKKCERLYSTAEVQSVWRKSGTDGHRQFSLLLVSGKLVFQRNAAFQRAFRLTVVNMGQEREHHSRMPIGQGILFNAYVELKAIPESRMLSEIWWVMLFVNTHRFKGHLRPLYRQMLPWLVQTPLDDLHRRQHEEALVSPFSYWCELRPETEHLLYSWVGVLVLLLLLRGHSRLEVDWIFFLFRVFFLLKSEGDMRLFMKHKSVLPPKLISQLEDLVKAVALEAAEAADAAVAVKRVGSHLAPQPWRRWFVVVSEEMSESATSQLDSHVLHMVLEKTMSVRQMLDEVKVKLRPPQPEMLRLTRSPHEPARAVRQPLLQQHLHWDAFHLLGRNSMELAGESLLDKDMSGLLGMHLFEKELYEICAVGDLTPVLCAQVLKRTLEVCIKLSNLTDAKWSAQLVCALLSNIFLKVLPMPQSNDHCIWKRNEVEYSGPDAKALPEYSLGYVTQTLQRLMEVLAHNSNVIALGVWHAELLLISGTIAAITDAVCRRDGQKPESAALTKVLTGAYGKLPGEELYSSGGASCYAIGIRSFERRTANVSFRMYHHYLARTAILDYFYGLKVQPCNELFDLENKEGDGFNVLHGSGKECATWRFFKKLGQLCYSRETNFIHDPHSDLLHMGPENIAFRDVMAYFKIFTLTADFDHPFQIGNRDGPQAALKRHQFSLRFIVKNQSYAVLATNCLFFSATSEEAENSKPILKPMETASSVSFHTARMVSGDPENDVLHIRRLPEFQGLQPSSVELLLQYLTVPYLRIPLVIEFFTSEDHINALKDPKLRRLVEAAIFEPGAYLPHESAQLDALHDVPPKDGVTATATRYGVLLNEVSQSGPRLLSSMTKLLKLVLTFGASAAEQASSTRATPRATPRARPRAQPRHRSVLPCRLPRATSTLALVAPRTAQTRTT